jgi:hypothetical protein
MRSICNLSFSLGFSFFMFVAASMAQVRTPEEEVKIAKFLADRAKLVRDLPIQADGNPERWDGVRSGQMGFLVIPDRLLTADLMQHIGDEVRPIGQLWCRGFSPIVSGRVIPRSELRVESITIDGKDRTSALFLLGVRRGRTREPELVVYSREKEPLMIGLLAKVDAAQDHPIEPEVKWAGESVDLSLRILGLRKCRFRMSKVDF